MDSMETKNVNNMASGGGEHDMGELLGYFETQSEILDGQVNLPLDSSSSDFISLIRFNGVPILPPVLTQSRREEMQSYKRQALQQSSKQHPRQRQHLHQKVQSIIAGVETQYSLKSRRRLPRTSGITKLLEDETEERRAAKASSKSFSSKVQHVTETVTKLLPGGTTAEEIPSEIQIQLPSSEADVTVSSVSSARSSGTPTKSTGKISASTSSVKEKSVTASSSASSVSTVKSNASVFKSLGRLSKTKSYSTQSLSQSPSQTAKLTADLSSNSPSPGKKELSMSPKSTGLVPRPPEGRPSSIKRLSALRQSYSFPDLRSIDFSDEAEELNKPLPSKILSPKGGRLQAEDTKQTKTTDTQKNEKEIKEPQKKTQLRTKPKEAFVKELSQSERNKQLQTVLQNAKKADSVTSETSHRDSPVPTQYDLVSPLEKLEKEIADDVDSISDVNEKPKSNVDAESEYLDPIQAAAAELLPASITEEQALATLDSLQPDLIASLEQQGESLPKDYNGIPLTTVKQQHIIQMLTRLSKALNIEDTLTSTTSSNASGEPGADAAGDRHTEDGRGKSDGLKVLKASLQNRGRNGSGDSSVKGESLVDSNRLAGNGDASSDSSNAVNDSRLQSVSPSSSAQTSVLSSGANTSTSSVQSRSRMSPTASILSSASSVTGSRARMSPKSLKNNTVHFSSFVTEISTSASQSYEDKISVRKLDITPVNSANFEAEETGIQGSDRISQNIPPPNTGSKNLYSTGSRAGPSEQQPDTLLSKVALSPDADSSAGESPGQVTHRGFPFLGHEGELNTSDKENEFVAQNEGSSEDNYRQDLNNHHGYTHGNYGNRNIHVLNCYSTNIPASTGEVIQPSLMKSSVKSDASESSTLKGSQDHILTEGGSGKLSMTKDLTGTHGTDSTSTGKYMQGSSATNSSSTSVPEEVNKPYLQQKLQQTMVDGNDKKGRGKYNKKPGRQMLNMADEASPILLRPVVYSHVAKASDNKSRKDKPNLQMVQLEEDKESEKSTEEAEPDIPEPIKTGEVEEEQEGKAEHIQKYLSQVHEHSLQHEEDFKETNGGLESNSKEGYIDVLDNIGATLQSFTSSIQSMNHLSHEELFRMQAEQFDLLQKQLIEQQRAQLEELFVQQRREQLSMQQEIELYQKKKFSQEDIETMSLTDSYPTPLVSQSQPQVMQAWQYQNQYPPFSAAAPVVSHNFNSRGGMDLNQSNGSNAFSYVQSPSLYRNPKDRDNVSEISSIPKASPKQLVFSNQSTPVPKVFKPVVRSPVKQPHFQRPAARVIIPNEVNDEDMGRKFDRVSAAVKGYLTRRLLRTQKVKEILKTINDTRNFAFSFQAETPIKKGHYSDQDRGLLERIVAQLQAALLDIHEIFFIIPTSERMAIIAHSRELEQTKLVRDSRTSRDAPCVSSAQPRISAATLKAIERKKKAQLAEEAVFGEFRPRSAPPATSSPHRSTDTSGPLRRHYHYLISRALRPLQGQVSPIMPDTARFSIKEVKERPRTAPDKSKTSSTALKSKRTAAGSKTSRTSTATSSKTTSTKTTTKQPSKVTGVKAKKQDKAWR